MRWLEHHTFRGLRRLSVNTMLQIGGQILPVGAAAVAIPFVYRDLGAADFGIFTIALSAMGLFSILDLGLGRALVRFAARDFARGDMAGAASIVAQSGIFLGAVSVTLALAVFLASPALASHWVRSSPGSHGTVTQCLAILAAALPIGAMTSVFRSVLEAREDFLSIGIVQSAVGTSMYAVILVLSLADAGVQTIIAAAVGSRLLGVICYVVRALAVWPDGFPWKRVRLRVHKDFRDFSFWTVGANVIGASIMYGDRVLLVKLFGLQEVPYYNVPLEFFGRLMILMNAVATVIFPALSRVSDNKQLFERAYVVFMTFLSAAAGLALLATAMATPQILLHWLGLSFEEHSTLIVRTLLVGLEFQCLNVMALASINARGVSRPITVMLGMEFPLYFCALAYFGLHLGLEGIAIVWSGRVVIEFLCYTLFQLRLVRSGGARSQKIGSALSVANAIPLVLVAVSAGLASAVASSAVVVTAAIAWSYSELRDVGIVGLRGERA